MIDEGPSGKAGSAVDRVSTEAPRAREISGIGAPLVSLSGVSKRFGAGKPVLATVDFAIASGEFVSLLGPSGCGKSTLLRIIAGLLQPTGGNVTWHMAANVNAMRTSRRAIGFVFQDATLMPWANALDNVAMPLRLAGMDRPDRHEMARQMLRRVGLADVAHAYPRELSGGMRMRVSLARALVTQPDILLMDEPFAALDEITRHRLTDDLLELWERLRFTAVFVTHSVFESVYLSQRILVMAAQPGRIYGEIVLPVARRDPSFRTSSEYAAECRHVSAVLKEAIEP